MIKRILFALLLFMFAASAWGQRPKAGKIEILTKPEDGEFCFPKINKAGTKVFFSTPSYTGLYSFDLKNRNIVKLTDERGAGYQSAVNRDGTEIIYRTYHIEKGRRYFSLIKQDLLDNKKTVLENSIRDISPAEYLDNESIAYIKNLQIKKISSDAGLIKKSSTGNSAFVQIENKKIALYNGDEKILLAPKGEGSYIWPEISPDGQRLLFKKLGDGCYISDLQGNIISDQGDINAPHWSPDGNWIVYMADKDDGYRLTESDIHIRNIQNGRDINLTSTKDIIEIYPEWGRENNTIVFCSEKGQIYLMHLNWN